MRAAGSLLACVAVLPAVASAAQWTLVPQVSLAADTDSNRRLRPEPHESQAALVSGSLALARLTEIGSFALVPRVSIARYSGEDALDSDDWGVLTSFRRSGERFNVDAQAGISDDSTLVTEPGETGFVEGNTRRRASSVNASFTQYVSTRHLFQYQLGAVDIDYQQTRGTGLVGYRYPSVAVTYAYSATPRLETTLSASAARLEAPDIRMRSDTRGVQIGFRYRISERFRLDGRVGRSETESRGRSDAQQSYHAGLSWEGELSRLELSGSRDVEPSGRGVLVNADDLRVTWSRELGERLRLDSTLRASRREDLDITLRRNEYRYGAFVTAISYRLDEAWTASLAGVYSRQEYERPTGLADGYRIGLNFNWRPLQ